jgi:hypothetical protein
MAIMSKEEFEHHLQNCNIELIVNNIQTDLRVYSGIQIHHLPELEATLGHISCWIRRGWFKNQGITNFRELSEKSEGTYKLIIRDFYAGLQRGLFKI